MEPYDSTPDTLAHIRRVQELLADMQHRLATRASGKTTYIADRKETAA